MESQSYLDLSPLTRFASYWIDVITSRHSGVGHVELLSRGKQTVGNLLTESGVSCVEEPNQSSGDVMEIVVYDGLYNCFTERITR